MMAGDRFGRWVLIEPASPAQNGKKRWLARCDCGVTRPVVVAAMKSRISASCGCVRAVSRRTHGMSKSKSYQAYATMISRCENPRFPKFKSYGARGIKVCQRWRHDFAAFMADMGERPEGMTLDRIDNDGDYEPSNCRWATLLEQSINKRNTVRLTHNGKTMSLVEWSSITGIPYGTIRQRIYRYGWSVEQALGGGR